uniref:Uncharacterized protein n=1 Tax=viral metagenome TaxID=1070528 RepID=A0A6H1Z9V6_9ZZZZ
MRKVSNKQIREYLGHGQGTCKVRIKSNGTIYIYGSTDDFDRSKDFWAFAGWKEDVIREITQIEMKMGWATR